MLRASEEIMVCSNCVFDVVGMDPRYFGLAELRERYGQLSFVGDSCDTDDFDCACCGDTQYGGEGHIFQTQS